MSTRSKMARVLIPMFVFGLAFALAPSAFAAQPTSGGDLRADTVISAQEDANEISGATITIADQVYTGDELTPAVTVVLDGKTLDNGKDYKVTYANNVNVGTATVTVEGQGDYTGQKMAYFTIAAADASKFAIAAIAQQLYSGVAISPKPAVTFNGKALANGKDYTLSYKNNVNAGKAQVIATGKGNFAGTKVAYFIIAKASIAKAAIKVKAQTYTGSALKPNPTVTYKGKKLVKGKDYTLKYKANTNVGKGQVTVTGKGNFTGAKTVKFTIAKASIAKATASVAAQTYTGKALKPAVTVKYKGKKLKKNRDYTVTYKSNTNAGTGKAILKGKGNLKGSKTVKFKIKKADIDDAVVSSIGAQEYTGSRIYPKFTIKFRGKRLKNNTDFTLDYDNNKEIGTATVNIIGKGNFTDRTSRTFSIVQRSLSDAKVDAIPVQRYTGSFIRPLPNVTAAGRTLVEGTDYTLSYSNNVNAGTATIYINGKGNYKGSTSVNFTIVNETAVKTN